MKKIGLCLIICMSMLTQTVFAHANSSEEISSEIDNKLPTVAVQFGKTKLNIGNELTLLQDEEYTSILFAGHQIQIANLNVKNVLGMGDAIQLLEENDCDNVLLVGEAIEMKGQYNKVYVSGANVVFEGQSDVLNIVGETIELTGTVKTASLTGDTVVISGTVTGQLKIAANHVEFTEDANVEGDIVIWSENQATVSNQLSEDRITYHHEDVIKWGYWLPTSLSIEMNWIAYGSLMVLTMLFGTLGLLSVRRIFSNVKRKAWRFVGLQVLISISVPLICAWGLSTYMAFKWLTIMTMYLS
ncbi:MAG TPA: hypothetical protein DCY20_10155, partial [Firmicutes bacterium]|nr:hypothetical protein [Bacillota bacterium]